MQGKSELFLAGDVCGEMTAEVYKYLATRRNEPVRINLNTEGGCATQAKQICAMIEEHGHVTVYAYATCMSAGVLILCSAKHRISSPDCEFLVHFGEEVNTSLDDQLRSKRATNWMRDLLASRVNVSKRTVTGWLRRETYMDATKALKCGLVDEVRSCL